MMMKAAEKFRNTRVIALVMLLVTYGGATLAQSRFGFEFRPGVNFPTRNLGDANLKTGFGFEGVFSYQILPPFGIYAGWGWNRFSADQSFAGVDVDFEETGYSYGLQFMKLIGESNVGLLARAGILSNHIEVEDRTGDVIGDSGHSFRQGIGWQVEGRVDWPLGDKWSLVPSLRFRSLPREIRIGAAGTEVVLEYVSLGIGISRSF